MFEFPVASGVEGVHEQMTIDGEIAGGPIDKNKVIETGARLSITYVNVKGSVFATDRRTPILSLWTILSAPISLINYRHSGFCKIIKAYFYI